MQCILRAFIIHAFVIHAMLPTYIHNTCTALNVTFRTCITLHIHLQYIQCILRTFIIHALHLQHMQCILRTFIITCTSFAIHTMYSTCTHYTSWDMHDMYYTLHVQCYVCVCNHGGASSQTQKTLQKIQQK